MRNKAWETSGKFFTLSLKAFPHGLPGLGKDVPPPPGIAKVYRKKALDAEDGGGEARRKRNDLESAALQPKREDPGRKGKTKYVNLSEGSSGSSQIPGRHACECQARKHELVSNCVACGRVVCAQEGSGPCLFCGALVVTREEQEVRMEVRAVIGSALIRFSWMYLGPFPFLKLSPCIALITSRRMRG